jgi:putative ABC transport system permease protein
MPGSTPLHDWRQHVRAHAAQSGIELPSATLDELAMHLDDVYQAARAEGLDDTAAQARAVATLNESRLTVLERHAVRSARVTEKASLNVIGAIRIALRQFQQHPTFALVVVLVLGLGTGAATTVFTAVDAVLLRPLPFAAPDRLVTLWDTNAEQGLAHDPISPVNFMDYRDLPVFTDAAAWWRPGVNLQDPGLDPARVNTIEVSGNVFEVLGVRPQIGAGFPENGPLFVTNELIIVISDRLWRNRYGADPSIIG